MSCPKLKILRMGNNRYRGVTKTDDELVNIKISYM
jgi:hypothetical protein